MIKWYPNKISKQKYSLLHSSPHSYLSMLILEGENPKTSPLKTETPNFLITFLSFRGCSSLVTLASCHLGYPCSGAQGQVSTGEIFSDANLASTLLQTSGSGAGSTFRGGARLHWEHLWWLHRVHTNGSMVSPKAWPSGLFG